MDFNVDNFTSLEEVRDFLLGGSGEFEEEFAGSPGACCSLSWKKDHWIVRINNKKVGIITKQDLPASIDIQNQETVFNMIKVLREASRLSEAYPEINPLEELKRFLAGVNE